MPTMMPSAAITPSFLSDFDSCVTNGLSVDVFSVDVIFSVDVVGVWGVDVSFSVDAVIVSGKTLVDVVIFSVDAVGVTVVDVNFSVVDVVGSGGVVILPVVIVDISSVDKCVVSGNVVVISVDDDVNENDVLCVVVVSTSVCVVINSSVISDKVLVGCVVHNVVVIALISNAKNKH